MYDYMELYRRELQPQGCCRCDSNQNRRFLHRIQLPGDRRTGWRDLYKYEQDPGKRPFMDFGIDEVVFCGWTEDENLRNTATCKTNHRIFELNRSLFICGFLLRIIYIIRRQRNILIFFASPNQNIFLTRNQVVLCSLCPWIGNYRTLIFRNIFFQDCCHFFSGFCSISKFIGRIKSRFVIGFRDNIYIGRRIIFCTVLYILIIKDNFRLVSRLTDVRLDSDQ